MAAPARSGQPLRLSRQTALAKPFDATTKYLVETYPADWLTLVGLPLGGPVEAIDANLSTITAEADKVLRVGGPDPWLAHVEFQTGREAQLARRLLRYNTLLDDRHDLPVRSVAILLRPAADGPELTGTYRRSLPGAGPFLEFGYDVLRIWKQPVESVLAGGIGTLPLAPVSDLGTMTPDEAIGRIKGPIEAQPAPLPGRLWAATGLLLGLYYPKDVILQFFRGVRDMEESSFYQAILEEGEIKGEIKGEARGKAKEARAILLKVGMEWLGPPGPAESRAVEAMGDVEAIEDLIVRTPRFATWGELLNTEATPEDDLAG